MIKSLKGKVSLLCGSLVLLIALLGIYSLFNMYQISRAVDSLIITNYNSIQRLRQMDEALYAQDAALLSYLHTGDAQDAASTLEAQAAVFREASATEYGTIILPQEMEMISGIIASYDSYCALFPEYLALSSVRADRYYQQRLTPAAAEVREHIHSLRVSNEAALFARKQEASEVVRHAAALLFGTFLVTIIIAYTTARIYTDKLFRPIYEVTQNLKAVRQGNMGRKTSVQASDELGSLAQEFNNMTQRLQEFEQSTMGQLMAERNRTMAIVRSITEPMAILDGSFCITLTNQSFDRLFSVEMDEVRGSHFQEAVAQSGLSAFSAVPYRSQSYTERVIQLGSGEEAKFYNAMVTPLAHDEPSGDAVIIVLYDITALKDLDRKRSDFIATISHEFKTPLTSMVIGVDLLSSGALGNMTDEQKEVFEALREDGQRLCSLVTDLLELSRIESAENVYRFERCSLPEVFSECIRQFTPAAERGGTTIVERCPDQLPDVRGDFSKITWVMNNLLSNAVKYTGRGDTITVSAFGGGPQFVTVVVSDTGTGIPEEYLERIFDKYVQVSSYDIEMRGSGLGLAVARAIITAHGGKIWCESNVRKGSRFLFTLPIYQNGGEALEARAGR